MADDLGLIIQVNYPKSQNNIDEAIKKLQAYVDTKKLHIAFDAESIKGLDQISKAIAPSINQVDNLNSSVKNLGSTVQNLKRESKIDFFQGDTKTQTKTIKELETAFGELYKVTRTFKEGEEAHIIVENTTNYEKQKKAVDSLTASKIKLLQYLDKYKRNSELMKNENVSAWVSQIEGNINKLNMSNVSKTNIAEIQRQINMLSLVTSEINKVNKAEEKRVKDQEKEQKKIEQNIQRQQQLYAGLFNQIERTLQQQSGALNTRMQNALGLGVKISGLSPDSTTVLEHQLERYKNIIRRFQESNELGIRIRPEQLTQLQNLENRIRRFYETVRQGQSDSRGFNFTQYEEFNRLNPAITNATRAQQYYNTSLLEGYRLIGANIQQTDQYIRVMQQLRRGSEHLNLGVYIDRATGQMYQFNEALRDGMTRSWGLGEAMSTAATKVTNKINKNILLPRMYRNVHRTQHAYAGNS